MACRRRCVRIGGVRVAHPFRRGTLVVPVEPNVVRRTRQAGPSEKRTRQARPSERRTWQAGPSEGATLSNKKGFLLAGTGTHGSAARRWTPIWRPSSETQQPCLIVSVFLWRNFNGILNPN